MTNKQMEEGLASEGEVYEDAKNKFESDNELSESFDRYYAQYGCDA